MTDTAYQPHEIAHAATLLNRGLPSFLAEGVAGRWQFGPAVFTLPSHVAYRGDLDYDRLISLLKMRLIPDDEYPSAAHFWSWLEAEYGAQKMGDLIASVTWRSSGSDVEAEFARIFGLSLRDAVAAAYGTPLLMWDDAACRMDLPRLEWSQGGLTVGGESGDCEADPFINTLDGRAGLVFLVEFPELGHFYPVDFEYVPLSDFSIYPCLGRPRPFEFTTKWSSYPPVEGDELPELLLSGLNVIFVTAEIGDDGHVRLPRLEFGQP